MMISDVNTQLDNIIKKFLNYDVIDVSTMKLNLKSNITYVDTSCHTIINRFQYYETMLGSDITLSTKADKLTTYLKTDVDVCVSISQAGMDRTLGSNLVDIDGKLKVCGESNDIFKIQKSRWFYIIRAIV